MLSYHCRVQLAYCSQKLGQVQDALQCYNTVLKNKPSDASVAAVAANNAVVLNKVGYVTSLLMKVG